MPWDRKKFTQYQVIMPHSLKDKIRDVAEKERRSMSAQVVFMIERYMKEHYMEMNDDKQSMGNSDAQQTRR